MATQTNLHPLAASSTFERSLKEQGIRFIVELTIRKSTRVKEYEKVEGTKLGLSPVLPPFKTLEEIAAAKAGTAVA